MIKRATLLIGDQWVDELRSLLGNNLEEFRQEIGLKFITIDRSRLREVAYFFFQRHFRLEGIWTNDLLQRVEVIYYFTQRQYLLNSGILLRFLVEKEIDVLSIADIFVTAEYFERNLTNRVGIQFHFPEALRPTESCFLYGAYQFPLKSPRNGSYQLGIFHPIHKIHAYLNICQDPQTMKIAGVKVRDGWLYQGFQLKSDQVHSYKEFMELAGNLPHVTQYHVNLALIQAIETHLDLILSFKIRYIRTLLAEIERIRSHLIWFLNLARLLQSPSYNRIERQYHHFNHELDEWLIDRVSSTIFDVGDAEVISPTTARKLYHYFRDHTNSLFSPIKKLTQGGKGERNLRGIGWISAENAYQWGLTGPSLRGSGIPIDVRVSDPYLIYTYGELSQVWNVISFRGGDCLSRTQVRLFEIQESINICKFLLSNLSNYESTSLSESPQVDLNLESGSLLYSAVESPQGALFLACTPSNKPSKSFLSSIHLITPDFTNFAAIQYGLIKDQSPDDIPLILHSLDLQFPMIDL